MGTITVSSSVDLAGLMMTPRPRLLLRTMFRSVVLLQLGSVVMFMAHVTTKGHRLPGIRTTS